MDSGLTSRLGVSKADCELTKLGFAFREQTILLCTFLYSADYDKKIWGSDSMMIFV